MTVYKRFFFSALFSLKFQSHKKREYRHDPIYLIILRPLSKFLTPAYYGSKHYRARLPTVW